MTRIIADFKRDWHEQLLEQMRSVWGDQVDQIATEDVPFRFFDSLRRHLSPRPRRVEIAENFVLPAGYEAGWANLQRKIEAGESLTPHQSKDHRSFINQDGLLDDWGIHHFHLGVGPHQKYPDLVERTPPVVFALVTDEVFYAINTYKHEGWAKTEVVETLHQNWPDAIRQFVIHGSSSDSVTEAQRTTLRKKRANCSVTVKDGTVYGPLGGTISFGGMTVEAVVRTDVCHDEIRRFQCAVEESAEQIVSQLKSLGHTVVGELRAKYVIHEGEMAIRLPDHGLTVKIAFETTSRTLSRHKGVGWKRFACCVKKRCAHSRLASKRLSLLCGHQKSKRCAGRNAGRGRCKAKKP